jgi:hypothetical protein
MFTNFILATLSDTFRFQIRGSFTASVLLSVSAMNRCRVNPDYTLDKAIHHGLKFSTQITVSRLLPCPDQEKRNMHLICSSLHKGYVFTSFYKLQYSRIYPYDMGAR